MMGQPVIMSDVPPAAVWWSVFTLQDYNTRMVVLSTIVLGIAAGMAGVFLLLRKRALMGDVLAHAGLPGVALAFAFMVVWGQTGRALPGLLLGAIVTGWLGTALVLVIRSYTRIKDDAAMGLVLSVFFGLGIALLGMVQSLPQASAAGLEGFIYGKTASMVQSDFIAITVVAALAWLIIWAFRKEFTLLCFDEHFTRSLGWSVGGLDVGLLAVVTIIAVVGMQAVGLILIIALLIIPAAAARFWTNDLRAMLWCAAAIGGLSGWGGAVASALLPRLPAGAVIVLVAATLFLFSLCAGTAHGVVRRAWLQYRFRRKIDRQHLLRALYEILETHDTTPEGPRNVPVAFPALLSHRSWSVRRVRRMIRQALREDHLTREGTDQVQLTEAGYGEAARITRNHRLWEIFLIRHADLASSHVDRDADAVEHVLSVEMVRELEAQLGRWPTPRSPHTPLVPERPA